MASLTGQTIASTYISLLKTSNNSPNLASGATTERIVLGLDADATDRTPLYVSQDRVGINVADPSSELEVSSATATELAVTSTGTGSGHHSYLVLSSSSGQNANSEVQFTSGASASKGRIIYDHHDTPASQIMQFIVGDNTVTALTIDGAGRLVLGMLFLAHC